MKSGDAPKRATKAKVAAPRPYHHGDLRAALMAAAREVLETAPPEAVTLKSLAVKLGVSQSAPYRHFETREAVLAAVAADGFVRFREALAAAVAGGDDADRFERAGLAYLDFGRANRGVYRLMFASPVTPTSDDAPLAEASERAFGFLLDGVAPYASDTDAYTVALWVWSTLHGLVMLEADCLAGGKGEPGADAAAVVRELMRGLERRARAS